MTDHSPGAPWVSFCISTYKRPGFLETQLKSLLQQTNPSFEIVVSDNDPDASGQAVVESLGDPRIRYFRNVENLGMIKSFNASIDRARTEYIVMVTDDDPVDIEFLAVARKWIDNHPGLSLYGGFIRTGKTPGALEVLPKEYFLGEILDPGKTTSLLWSCCVLKRADALAIGKIPDFGSPHLADHALLVMTGSIAGGVVVNKMYSSLTLHEANFSKFNVDYYVKGCKGFHDALSVFCKDKAIDNSMNKRALIRHLGKWFISNFSSLRRHYSLRKDEVMLRQIDTCAKDILSFSFMQKFKTIYNFKKVTLFIKIKLGLLKA